MSLSDYLKRTQYILVSKLLLGVVFVWFRIWIKIFTLSFREVRKAAKTALRTLRHNGIALEVGKEMFLRRVQVSQSPSLLQTWKGYERKYGFIGDSWCPGDQRHWEPALKPFVSTRVELVHHRNTCNDVPWCPQDSGIEHATRLTRCFCIAILLDPVCCFTYY